MLVLTRKINQTIVIGGNIRVTLAAIRNSEVRLAIDAPLEVGILRAELLPDPPDALPVRCRPPTAARRADLDRLPRPRGTGPRR